MEASRSSRGGGDRRLLVLVLMLSVTSGSGLELPQPDGLQVNIEDGHVVALWDAPALAHSSDPALSRDPAHVKYNVQIAKYNMDNWAAMASCTSISATFCDLTSLIEDYSTAYRLRVQTIAGGEVSEWRVIRKFLPNNSGLQPPSFSVLAWSGSLQVRMERKSVLKKLFPYGVTYTIFLEEAGPDMKNTTAFLRDDFEGQETGRTFEGLQRGSEYCVSVMVEGNGALSASATTARQCVVLPEREWFLMAVCSITAAALIAVAAMLLAVCYIYLWRPAKTPVALKSLPPAWLPLGVEKELMEVVTDKAWLLTAPPPCQDPPEEGKDRRSSMDSGADVDSSRGSPLLRQVDSGCGSLGDSGELPLLDGRTEVSIIRSRQDSGVGLSCQPTADEQGRGGGASYRSQNSPLTDLVSGKQACVCSGAGQCRQCHRGDHYGRQEARGQAGAGGRDVWKGHTQGDMQRTQDMAEGFPLLTALLSLPLVEGVQDFSRSDMTLSLFDVQLETD